jgi:hypothetical protein
MNAAGQLHSNRDDWIIGSSGHRDDTAFKAVKKHFNLSGATPNVASNTPSVPEE